MRFKNDAVKKKKTVENENLDINFPVEFQETPLA